MSNKDDLILGRHSRENALHLGPRKKPTLTDPLVHHGHHFGRTVHALCRIHTLLTNGILCEVELVDRPDESFTAEERREYWVYRLLLQMVPGLEEHLLSGSEEEILHVADLVQKGSSNARADDTKSLKRAIIDWITPKGGSLQPPLACNVKADRGFHHEWTGALICPTNLNWSDTEIKEKLRSGEITATGDEWPLFLYHGFSYNPKDPWNGLFRSSLLVTAYKHIFTLPSSVDKEPRATRSGNARIHGMTSITLASIAYIAMQQVRFALSSSPIFSQSDLATDSEQFYNSVLDLFEDVDEQEEVNDLLEWWNRQIFPSYSSQRRPAATDNVLASIKQRRQALCDISANPHSAHSQA
ncbi:hypothetical protein L208DRAFT_1539586 [Tricholoma matsutake]|nr:hypothetical protein L208DRAFT_1539586 [Tricholoma matsutake 945]